MCRAVTVRLLLLVSFVAFIGGTASGQSSSTKASSKRAPAKAVAAKAATAEPAPPADVRIQTKYTSGAQVSENTTYVKGARQRVEFPGVVSIEQCDLGQTVVINPTAKTYLVTRHADVASATTPAPAAAPGADQPGVSGQEKAGAGSSKGGVVTYTTTVNDTGEKKQVFGREARRVTTTMTKTVSASACDKTPLTVEVDGWYIDFPAVARCSTASSARAAGVPRADACVDQVESRVNGEAKLGFPVATTTTTKTGEGDKQEVETSSMEVTAFEVTTLDAALFGPPEGYTEVKSNAELMATFQGGGGGLSDALVGSTADGTSAAAPKRAGAVRIGVLEPLDKSGHELPVRELRQQLASGFHRAPYEALTLSSDSVAGAQSEAARMECDYILYAEITEIKTSKPGRLGGMLKKVSRDGPPRDVHEVKLDYRLYRVGAADASPAFSESVKSSSGTGFGLRSAIHLAVFAGSLYMRFSGLGLVSPWLMANMGGGLGPLAGSGLFDPRLTAMSSMSQMFGPSAMEAIAGDAAMAVPGVTVPAINPEVEIRQTVDAALANAAKGTMEQLKKNTRR